MSVVAPSSYTTTFSPDAGVSPFVSQSVKKDKGFGSIFRPKFLNDNLWEFYNGFRLFGYLAEAHYSEGARFLAKKFPQDLEHGKQKFEPKLFKPDWKYKPYLVLNLIEAGIFSALALGYFFKERSKYLDQFGDVVAEELGKSRSKIGLVDLFKSSNPFIVSAVSKLRTQTIMRIAQPLSFVWGLKLGVTATVFEVTMERAIFMHDSSFDRLNTIIRDAQNNLSGTLACDTTVLELNKLMQLSREENHGAPITQAELEAYAPLLHRVSDHIIHHRFGRKQVIAILGQLIDKPSYPEKVWNKLARAEEPLLKFTPAPLTPAEVVPQDQTLDDQKKVVSFAAREPRASEKARYSSHGPRSVMEHATREEDAATLAR